MSLFFVIGSLAAPFVTPPTAPQPDPQKVDCSKTTDAEITTAVWANIKKRFTPAQMSGQFHFSMWVKDGVVFFSGDAHGLNRKDPREVRTRLNSIAAKTDCVKKVNTKHLTEEHAARCHKATEKACNGGCIKISEECNPIP
jgi:hypothetical protein